MFYLLGEVLNVSQSSISFVNLKVYQLTMGTCFNHHEIIGRFHSCGQHLY